MDTESIATERSRLYWQCRRGMLELDILLQEYCRDRLADSELTQFADLLTCSDEQLYGYLMGRVKPTDVKISKIVNRIRNVTDIPRN